MLGASIVERAWPRSAIEYEVALEANDLLDFRVTQDEALVRITLRDPRDGTAHVSALPALDPLPARLLYIATEAGVYRLEVYLNGRDEERDVEQQFTVEVLTLGPATADDAERVRLAHLADRAGALALEQTYVGIEQAIPLFQEAAAGWRARGELELEAAALMSLGKITSIFTRYRAVAADAFRRLADAFSELGNVEQQAFALEKLAIEYDDDGQLTRARDAARDAAALSRGFADRRGHARYLQYGAHLELLLGNYEESRRRAGEALDLAAAAGDASVEGRALVVLAQLQDLSGDIEAAIQQHERGLTKLTNPLLRRGRLTSLGFLYLRAQQPDQAEKRFEEGLALARRAVNVEGDALARIGLGDVAEARGDRARARTLYDEARSRLLKSGHVAFRCMAETRLGRLLLAEGDLAGAHDLFDGALAIGLKVAIPTCEAESRAGLADVALERDQSEAAYEQALRVVELSDRFREASANVDARTVGFSRLAPAYERAVEVTMQLARGDPSSPRVAEALSLNERALARGLLDALSQERLERRARVPSALEGERRQLRETWRARVVEYETALQLNPSRVVAVRTDIASISTRLREVEARIDAADPRHAAFARPAPLGVDDIRGLLDADTILLEYALGDARSYVWVVDRTSVRAFPLAPRATIEAAARRAHAHLADVPRGTTTAAGADAGRRSTLDELSRLVLEPVAPLLTSRRLVVVAPGALALVPFGVLATSSRVPMLARYEVVSLPSATVLAALRAVEAKRPAPSKTVAVVADPVYERDDPRLAGRRRSVRSAIRFTGPGETVVVPRGWTQAQNGVVALARLPFSGREVDAIRRYAPRASVSFVGLDANRERILAADLADYRILHFAAHGLLQPEVPNMSGIALSLVDARGRTRNGFLMLPDIYELSLNADLVVLSACETGRGHEVRGEGVVGLPRGFMYAGAARVISSAWRVDDEATAALMEAFYRRLLRDGSPPAAALRSAQLEIRAIPRWRAPFFWAGFVLQGDWR